MSLHYQLGVEGFLLRDRTSAVRFLWIKEDRGGCRPVMRSNSSMGLFSPLLLLSDCGRRTEIEDTKEELTKDKHSFIPR